MTDDTCRISSLLKKYAPYLLDALYAFLATFSLVIKLKIITPGKIAEATKLHSMAARFLTDLQISLSVSPAVATALFILCYLLFRKVRSLPPFSRTQIFTFAAIGLFFAACSIFGSSFGKLSNAQQIFSSPRGFAKNGIALVGYALLYSYVLRLVFASFAKIPLINRTQTHYSSKKLVFFGALIICLCWAPYVLSHYPGIFTADSTNQLLQFVGIKDITFQQLSAPLSSTVFLNDSNPVATTLLIGGFYKLGVLIGNQNIGMFIYMLLQTVFLAFTLSYSLVFAWKKGLPTEGCLGGLFFFCFLPMFVIYAPVLLTKSVLVPGIYLLYTIMLYQLIFEKESHERNTKFLIGFALVELAFMLFVKSGLYVVLFTSIALCIYHRKSFRYIALATLVPVIFVKVVLGSILFPALLISPGKSAELFSIPFQQTARYVKYHSDEVTNAEREAINRVLKFDQIAEYYNPTTSDGIKDYSYRPERSGADLVGYFKAWASMGIKHPLTYIGATFNNQYRYFQVNNTGKIPYTWSSNKNEIRFMKEGVVRAGIYPVEGSSQFKFSQPESLKTVARLLEKLEKTLMELPPFSFFMSMGIYSFLCVSLIAFGLLKKNGRYLLFMVPTITNYLILIASPYSAPRYLLPIIYTVFFLAVVYIIETNKTQESCTELETTSL